MQLAYNKIVSRSRDKAAIQEVTEGIQPILL